MRSSRMPRRSHQTASLLSPYSACAEAKGSPLSVRMDERDDVTGTEAGAWRESHRVRPIIRAAPPPLPHQSRARFTRFHPDLAASWSSRAACVDARTRVLLRGRAHGAEHATPVTMRVLDAGPTGARIAGRTSIGGWPEPRRLVSSPARRSAPHARWGRPPAAAPAAACHRSRRRTV